jgi:glycerol-3-phosphate dehydrogenase (NAD+)
MISSLFGRSSSSCLSRARVSTSVPKRTTILIVRGLSSQRRKKVPSSHVPRLWAQAQAVCFDVDCTVTKQDALDDLANFLGKGEQVERITHAAMNGDMDLSDALQARIEIMEPTLDDLKAYVQSNPAAPRLVPGIQELVQELQARNVEVFLISGGFRELILPVADLLKIPRENIYANRFVYMSDDDARLDVDSASQTIRVTGFDRSQVTSREGGKPEAIRQIRAKKPLQTVVMCGDGITDLEAVEEAGGADLFVGYGGVVERQLVKDNADWWVTDYKELLAALPRFKVAMVGSGAFASAVMQMISQNARDKAIFQDRVDMFVYEEDYQGSTLTNAINQDHENPKYLPGVHFGDNVVASAELEGTVKDADLIVFCAPHQFMHSLCKEIQLIGVKPTAKAISLTKGIHISPDQGPQLMSSMIQRMLNIECSVLMGANLAGEIGPNGLSEATIGSRVPEQGHVFQQLFDTDYFHVSVIPDIEGAELAGALKNVVALAAGFADGCDLGQNAKAAIMRQGLSEMRRFAKAMYPNTVRDETFFESCGVADLIATCYGGRNHRVAQEFAKHEGSKSFATLEAELLNGQKLQGVLTSMEVQSVLKSKGLKKDYPLFMTVNAVIRGHLKPKDISRFRSIEANASDSEDPSSLLEKKMGL